MSPELERDKILHLNRQSMYEECNAYRRSFIDSETGLLRESLLEARSCPCCGSSSKSFLFIKNGGTYVKCSKCSMVFLDPVFKDDDLIKYYKHNNVAQAKAHQDELHFYRQVYGQGLGAINQFIGDGSLLDIGCSSGLFLDMSRDLGYQTFGIELNQSELMIAQSKGHHVWGEPIEKVVFPTLFDAISLWDVFEHIKDGISYLSYLKKLIKPNGIIFMQIPSADSLAARILHASCNMFDGIEHVNLYGVSTIAQVASAAGFTVKSLCSIIDELAPIANHLAYEPPYSGSFELSHVDKIFDKNSILSNLRGYKLQVVLVAQ